MRAVRCALLSLVVASAVAIAAPIPQPSSPLDGGWTQRRADLTAQIPPPRGLIAVDFEVQDPGGIVVSNVRQSTTPTSSSLTSTTVSLPDAGFFTWRTRGLDDAGTSAWSGALALRVDGIVPPSPANFALSVDGGVVFLSSAPVTDLESGLAYYHFVVSTLDALSSPMAGDARFQAPSPSLAMRVGPGTWRFGLHTHDRVDNYDLDASVPAGPITVVASATAPIPSAPFTVRSDGGPYPDFPYLPTATPRWRSDAGPTATGFVLTGSDPDSGVWALVGDGTTLPLSPSLEEGPIDLRLAAHHDTLVSDWGPEVRVWIDTRAPNTPAPTATLDAGLVSVRWPRSFDTSGGSGVREYRVSRCCRDLMEVPLPGLATNPDASVLGFDETPGPGQWTYSVSAVDRASNVGNAGTALLTFPPETPTGLSITPLVGHVAVTLTWAAAPDDGGFVTRWNVRRVDLTSDAGVDVATALPTPRFEDPAPEGVWRWELTALVNAAESAPAVSPAAVVDLTPPIVDGPRVRRTGLRSASLDWTVTDALSGVDAVVLERETDGVVSVVGSVTAPFEDQPSDGTHRYRLVATDLAGNQLTSPFSPSFVTPGAGVQIAPVPAQLAQCGRPFSLQLSADEAVTWSTTEPATIDADGLLQWTPSRDDVGARQLEVTASASTSTDRRAIDVEVQCEPLKLAIGCSTTDGLWLLAALAWCRRLSARSRR